MSNSAYKFGVKLAAVPLSSLLAAGGALAGGYAGYRTGDSHAGLLNRASRTVGGALLGGTAGYGTGKVLLPHLNALPAAGKAAPDFIQEMGKADERGRKFLHSVMGQKPNEVAHYYSGPTPETALRRTVEYEPGALTRYT